MNWYIAVLKKYAVFSGLASRSEFWSFMLVNIIISLPFYLSWDFTGAGFFLGLYGLYNAAVFLPTLGVATRRLHDTGRSGWWLIVNFVPFFGTLILLVLLSQGSHSGVNKYE